MIVTVINMLDWIRMLLGMNSQEIHILWCANLIESTLQEKVIF